VSPALCLSDLPALITLRAGPVGACRLVRVAESFPDPDEASADET
jgi:hypothetical protein